MDFTFVYADVWLSHLDKRLLDLLKREESLVFALTTGRLIFIHSTSWNIQFCTEFCPILLAAQGLRLIVKGVIAVYMKCGA